MNLSMIKKTKVIIFDVDGTLIDTDNLVINSYHEVFKKYRPNYKLTKEEEISFLGPTLASIFPKYFKEDFDTLFQTYRNYAINHLEDAKLYPNCKEVLSKLKDKGFKLAIVTSRFKNSLMGLLCDFKIDEYFDFIVTLDDVKKPKPDPEGINKVLKHFNCSKNEAIYIGDNDTDYYAGQSARVITGLVTWTKGRDNAYLKPDILLYSYEQLYKEITGENLNDK